MISVHKLSSNSDAPASECGIYAIRNNVNGKFYVGQVGGTNGRGFLKRCQEHFYNATESKAHHSYSSLGRSIRKHGAENFDFIVLEVISKDCDNEVFHAAEVKWMHHFNSITPNGYNVQQGPTPRGVKRSPETRARMSEARKQALRENPELLEKLRGRLIANNKSVEAKARTALLNADPDFQKKRIAALRSKFNCCDAIGLDYTPKPKVVMSKAELQEKRRAIISEKNADRSFQERAHAVRREKMKDPEFSAAVKQKQSARFKQSNYVASNFRRVVCIETGEIFNSIAAAGRNFGVTGDAVLKQIQGKNKTCKGLHFSYFQE